MTLEDASGYLQNASDGDPALLSPDDPIANQAPSWPRPRTPIPPHRLAKLVNALGISAPVPFKPAANDPALSATSLSIPLTPEARRSPAPSVPSTPHSPAPLFQSKFLLHVIPPLHIPHEPSSPDGSQLTPSPASASGYHTQFERGTLVPLLPTLQSQLWAIAKEYALPSTVGMILYLVSSAQSPNPEASLPVPDEPGPRLSDDIWKHLWTRVTKFETESYSRLTTPDNVPGLGFGYVGHSSLFPQEFSSSNVLRPLISPGRVTPQSFHPTFTLATSTASSNPPSRSTSSETSQSEVDTPDTSLPSDSRAATLDLPGLTSPSVIPILAKVEFDIDKRKAAWYEPWIRSRKLNHQKREQRARTESLSGTSPVTGGVSQVDIKVDAPKAAPLPLRLVDRQAIPRFLLSTGEGDDGHEPGYRCLSESPPCLEELDLDSVVNPLTGGGRDPLPDVLGPDGDTRADMRSNTIDQPGHVTNPDIVEPAPDRHALSEPVKTEGDLANGSDEEEVQAPRESLEQAELASDIPSSPLNIMLCHPLPTAGAVMAGTYRKAPPPPLNLMPHSLDLSVSAEPSPLPTSSSTRLAYLRDGVSTPSDGDKRTGTIFDDLDLDLDVEVEDTGEFDENDPNDRRRSQYVLKAKLDEIEKTLVRLSPRGLRHEAKFRERPMKSPLLSPSSSSSASGMTPGSANSPSFSFSTSGHGPLEQGSNEHPIKPSAVWPAVPHSSMRRSAKADSFLGLDDFPAPPKLSLNGIGNVIPVSPYKKSGSIPQDTEVDESEARRELNGHEHTYLGLDSPSFLKPASSDSPIIPLSPDPFGRFPSSTAPPSISQASISLEIPLPRPNVKYSTFEIPPEWHSSPSSPSHKDSLTSHLDSASRPPSSRFSLDSTDEGKNNWANPSLNPVKSIKSLWKKGRKASISFGSGSVPALETGSVRTSPQSPPPVPSLSNASTPRSITPAPSNGSRESVTSPVLPSDRRPTKTLHHDTPFLSTAQLQQSQSSSSINSMVFYSESPYPVHVLPPNSTSRPRTASQAARALSSASLTEVGVMPSPTASTADREKTNVPKSILKSRRTDSSASPLSPEHHATRGSQSRADSMMRTRSTFMGGGGRLTPPSSPFESMRVSPLSSRRRSSRAPTPSQMSPDDETFKPVEPPVPRLELDQRI
ncbi:hypothetical protein BJV74DRAFT_826445 [Russula compacta]|nr:hypothetical protein BJV74DRAFT_826445 [Russula compacta]